MSEENEPEWQAYSRAVSILGDIVHLIENHKKEADEVKKLCRKRLDWEKKAHTMSNATIESLQ